MTVEELGVAFVVAVFGRVAPVARAFANPPAHRDLILDQLLGNVRLDGWWRALAKVHPHQAEPFGNRVCTHTHPTTQRRIRSIGQTGDHDPTTDVVGPAVVDADPGAGRLLPTPRQRPAAMPTAVVQR